MIKCILGGLWSGGLHLGLVYGWLVGAGRGGVGGEYKKEVRSIRL